MDNNHSYVWTIALWMGLLLFVAKVESKDIACKGIKLKRLGCYADSMNPRPLPNLLLTYRDRTSRVYAGKKIGWQDFGAYLEKFVCRCADESLKKGYGVMGLQFYGECWSGPNSRNYAKDGASTNCKNNKHQKCQSGMDCVGAAKTNFVYGVQNDTLPTPTKRISTPSTPRVTTPSTGPSPTPSPTKPTTPGISSPKPSGLGTSTVKRPPSPTKFPIPCIYPHSVGCIQPASPCMSPPCQAIVPPPAPQLPYPGIPVAGQPSISCGPQCPLRCAPSCKSSCCQSFTNPTSIANFPLVYPSQNRRNPPFQAQAPAFQPLRYPQGSFSQRAGCSQSCLARCAPECLPKCCRWFGGGYKRSLIGKYNIPNLEDD